MSNPTDSAEVWRRPRNKSIQGLRAACVLAIFIFHVLNSGLAAKPETEVLGFLYWIAGGLKYGVEVFFMISGYVIIISLRRHENIREFLKDRALRIFPLWLPLALTMLLGHYVVSGRLGDLPLSASSLPALLISLAIMSPVLPVPSIHPAQWSLNYELWFYGFASLGWRLGASSLWRTLCWAVPATVFVILFPRALFFVPGVLVALAEPRLVKHKRFFRLFWLGLPVAWLAWLSTGVEAAELQRTLVTFFNEGLALATITAFVGATAFFAWLVVCKGHDEQGWLCHPAMQWLGTISYSFYLVHPIVMAGVKRGLLPHLHVEGLVAALLFGLIAFPLSCLGSWATWSLFEVRFRRQILAITTRRGVAHIGGAPS